MAYGTIFDIRKYSIHDGPGIRTAVFFKGCPARCSWCHNPESQSPGIELMHWPGRCTKCLKCIGRCPRSAIQSQDGAVRTGRDKCEACGVCIKSCTSDARTIVGRIMSADEVMQEISKDIIFYDGSAGGATFTGGEPLMQPEFLADLLDRCRWQEIHTAVDTSGIARLDTVKAIAERADLFLYDLKMMDDNRHQALTGVPLNTVLRNFEYLAGSGYCLRIRVPVIPGINDSDTDILSIIDYISSVDRAIPVDLLAYHTMGRDKYGRLGMDYALTATEKPSKDQMDHIRDMFRSKGIDAGIGG